MNTAITHFRGKYKFLSNMYLAKTSFESKYYPSVENAFQAAKVLDDSTRRIFRVCSSQEAKKEGKRVPLRTDWEDIKLDVMYSCLKSKFEDPTLRQQLLDTGDAELIETNNWGDTFWGICKGEGSNHLGKLLMQLREEIR